METEVTRGQDMVVNSIPNPIAGMEKIPGATPTI